MAIKSIFIKNVRPVKPVKQTGDQDERPKPERRSPYSYVIQCDFCSWEVPSPKDTPGDAADEARRRGMITVPGVRLTDPSSWCCLNEQCRKKATSRNAA